MQKVYHNPKFNIEHFHYDSLMYSGYAELFGIYKNLFSQGA